MIRQRMVPERHVSRGRAYDASRDKLEVEARVGAAPALNKPYVPSAANDATLAEMVAQGFSPEQAKAIIANAKVTPQKLADDARERLEKLKSAAGQRAVQEAMALGFTQKEAESLVASGRNIAQVAQGIQAISQGGLDKALVEQLVKQGLSKKDAELLVATGGKPEKLLDLVKRPKEVASLLRSIDGRLKKEGIDLSAYAAKGLGLSEASQKDVAKVAAVAQSAFGLYSAISDFTEGYRVKAYNSRSWDESTIKNDESMTNLASALDEVSVLSRAERERRAAVVRNTVTAAGAAVSTTASAFGPVGMAIGAAVSLAAFALNQLGVFAPGPDENADKYKQPAIDWASKLWKEWRMSPPSWDSRYFNLHTYRDINEACVKYLDASDAEMPWKVEFYKLMLWAQEPELPEDKDDSKLPRAVVDLVLLEWFPFSFIDWMGGANMNAGSHWIVGSVKDPDYRFSGYSGESLPDALITGGDGEPDDKAGNRINFVFNQKTMTREARANLDGIVARGQDPYGSLPPTTTFRMPRGLAIQSLICERIAATLGTLAAARAGVPVEPVALEAVKACREMVKLYGWQPRWAAWRLRDTFRTIQSAIQAQNEKKFVAMKSIAAFRINGKV